MTINQLPVPRLRQRVAMFLRLDDLHAFKGRDAKVREIATKVVNDLGPNASMAVLMTSGDKSTQVGENKERLLEAINTYHGRKAVRRPTEANDLQRLPIKSEFGGACEKTMFAARTSPGVKCDHASFPKYENRKAVINTQLTAVIPIGVWRRVACRGSG